MLTLVGCGQEASANRSKILSDIEEKNAVAPISSNDYVGIDYFEIEELFYNSGFKNIYATPIEWPDIGHAYKNGEINFIKIGDKVNFKKNDEFDPYVKVDIKYILLVDSYGNYIDSSYTNIQSITDTSTEEKVVSNNDYNNISGASIEDNDTVNVSSNVQLQGDEQQDTSPQAQVNASSSGSTSNVGMDIAAQQVSSVQSETNNAANIVENVSQTSSSDSNTNQSSITKGDRYDSDGILIYIEPDADGEVWVPVRGGKKYHRKSECSGMIDPVWVNVPHATELGYTPCKKCAKY